MISVRLGKDRELDHQPCCRPDLPRLQRSILPVHRRIEAPCSKALWHIAIQRTATETKLYTSLHITTFMGVNAVYMSFRHFLIYLPCIMAPPILLEIGPTGPLK
ncbi:hypothetical protein OBBRIDRAFT_169889 [Obba rivulosa]|uniref:Uncharacterized protein n=1 Tax=Obba rivulosa TaxID=1052685 RepID=A0A8E2AMJ3_9APHY|nr:hypothetical protein OBBRIDRAFT_169889 [Obba rivulosa]